jgi:hypothetical protein
MPSMQWICRAKARLAFGIEAICAAILPQRRASLTTQRSRREFRRRKQAQI